MQINFNRAEFFMLAALMRADGIIGLDPSRLLPETAAERQALYAAGEASLIERKLLRLSGGEAQLEENVMRLMGTVTRPQTALVTVKTLPSVGQQLFLHYGQAGVYVEQTLPNEQTHHLADVGDTTQMRERLQDIFPLSGAGADGAGFELDTAAMLAAYNFIRDGNDAEGLEALAQNGPVGPAQRAFFESIKAMQYSGTIAMMQIVPDQESEAREFAVVSGAGRAWLMIGAEDGKSQIGAIDASSFGRVMDTLIAALNA
jgi:hypothetical protein